MTFISYLSGPLRLTISLEGTMALTTDELPGHGASPSVVTIHSPEWRVFLWLDKESPIMSWQVGDAVGYRNGSWVVVDRSEDGDSLSLTLGADA